MVKDLSIQTQVILVAWEISRGHEITMPYSSFKSSKIIKKRLHVGFERQREIMTQNLTVMHKNKRLSRNKEPEFLLTLPMGARLKKFENLCFIIIVCYYSTESYCFKSNCKTPLFLYVPSPQGLAIVVSYAHLSPTQCNITIVSLCIHFFMSTKYFFS